MSRSSLRSRLVKMLPLIGSPVEGERQAAIEGINRLLAGSGKTAVDIPDVIAGPGNQNEVTEPEIGDMTGRVLARWLLDFYPHRMTAWEKSFALQIAAQRREATPRQCDKLAEIYRQRVIQNRHQPSSGGRTL